MRDRYLLCGGRDYENFLKMLEILRTLPRNSIIVNGAAPGADELARRAALWLNREERKNFWVWDCPADWDALGKGAGPVRNGEMLEETSPSRVFAFPGGRGTTNMVEQARSKGIGVTEVEDSDG